MPGTSIATAADSPAASPLAAVLETKAGRLVSFQNWPDAALPDALQEGNPLGLWRMVDGKFGRH